MTVEPGQSPVYQAALTYLDTGWSVHPLRGKVPVVPAWQTMRSSKADAWSWWVEDGHDGIGIICGEVSGNLLVIDVEGRLAEDAGRMAVVVRKAKKAGVLEQLATSIRWAATTPSGGRHLFFQVVDGPAPGNEKLCFKRSSDGREVLLAETRGEGGQVAAPPAEGREWLQEPMCSLVTGEELQAILDSFRALDESVKVAPPPPKPQAATGTGYSQPSSAAETVAEALAEGLMAGELAWSDVLDPGWTLVGYDSAGRSLWLRPAYGGAQPTSESSAHGFERYSGGAAPVLAVHSSAVPHLPSGGGMRLTPGRVMAYCSFGGDEAAAYRALEEAVTLGVLDPRLPVLPAPVMDRVALVCQRKLVEVREAPAPAEPLPVVDVDEDEGEAAPAAPSSPAQDLLLGAFERLVAGEEVRLRARIEAKRRIDTGDWIAPDPAMRLRDLLDLDIPPLAWRVDQLLTEDGTAVLVGARKAGKALSIDEHLLTANRGWVRNGDIVPGDQVFHPDGSPVTVTDVSDVMTGHDCYRVTFADGRALVVDAEHLWTVHPRHRNVATMTTRELLDAGLLIPRADGVAEYRFRVPVPEPLKAPDVDLPVDPYVLGVWLGDGTSCSGEITNPDPEVWSSIQAAGYSFGVERKQAGARRVTVRGLVTQLRDLGILGNKRIPEQYLLAGTSQRLDLLRGLCDSDGTVSRRGAVELSFNSEALADGAQLLVRSLGWKVTRTSGPSKLYGRTTGTRHRLRWNPSVERSPFRLERQTARLKQKGRTRADSISIVAIDPVPSVPVRCLKVDRSDGLFLAGRDLVPTHNTSVLMHLAKCLVDGRPFLGRFDVVKPDGTVYLLDYEMSQRQGRAWLEAANIQAVDRLSVQFLRKKRNPMLTEAGREWLVNDLRRHEVQVLIADPLAVMFAGLMESENDNAGLRRALALLDGVAAESGVREILLAAHAGKDADKGARGASAIEDWPDALWRLFRSDDEEDPSRYFSAMGRDVEVAESKLTWDRSGRGLVLDGPGVSRRRAREGYGVQGLAQAVAEALQLTPGLTLGALKQAVGNRSDAVLLAVQELRAMGLVSVEGEGRKERFSLTDDGEGTLVEGSGLAYEPPPFAGDL